MFLLSLKLDIHSLSCGAAVELTIHSLALPLRLLGSSWGRPKSLSRPSRIRLRSLTRSFAHMVVRWSVGRSVGRFGYTFHLVFERESSRSRIPFIIYQRGKVRISSDRIPRPHSLCWRDGKDDNTRLGGRMGRWACGGREQTRRKLKSKTTPLRCTLNDPLM